jgi:hypothetical protein
LDGAWCNKLSAPCRDKNQTRPHGKRH